MKYDLIIYDCDGTLVDTHVPVNQAFLDTLAKHGYSQFDLGYIERECFGLSVSDLMKRLSLDAGHDLPEEIIPEYQLLVPDYLSRHVQPDEEQVRIICGLGEIFKQCVASNGLINNVKASISAAGLSSIFAEPHIFVSGHVARPKPFPDLIHHVQKVMGSKSAIGIEDSPTGIQALTAAGVPSLGFTRFASDKQALARNLKAAGALHVFDTWPQVENHLRFG